MRMESARERIAVIRDWGLREFGIRGWGLGFGDWELGIRDWGLGIIIVFYLEILSFDLSK